MKPVLRQQFLEERRKLRPRVVGQCGKKIAKKLFALPVFKKTKVIAAYVDFDNEVPTRAIIQKLFRLKKTVAVPKMKTFSKTLSFHVIQSLKELAQVRFGILEPPSKNPAADFSEIGVVLVPGVGFDERGFRLGYGIGFFDRTLPKLKKTVKIGLGFEAFVVPQLPVEVHDQAMDILVTEKKVRVFNQKKGGIIG